MAAMPRILLSGFGPFPGVPTNPTELLVRRFAGGKATSCAGSVATRLLSTEFAGAAARLAEAIEAERPEAVVMLGVAGTGPLRLERLARNGSRPGRPDAAGVCQGPGPILEGAPATYSSTLPLGALFRALEGQGLPVGWSDDAGGYVCNDLFFRTRHLLDTAGPAVPCGFLHVPPAAGQEEQGRMTLEAMACAVETVLAVVARRLAEPADWRVEAAPADFHDWAGLLALIRRAFAGMEGRIDPPSSAHSLTPESLEAKAREERLLLVRDQAGRPLACAFLRLPAAAGRAAYLGKIAVEPSLQGRGLARALASVAERLSGEAGSAAIELQSRVELLDNHRMFAALGFSRIGETAHPGYDRPTSVTFQKSLRPAASCAVK